MAACAACSYNQNVMKREEAIAALRSYMPVIRRDFGVRRLALFGSTARGDARDDSDLDLLVEFENGPTFLSFMGLKVFLEDHLGRKVDLVTRDALKPRLRHVVDEAVDVA
jgi:predicted nucleotidyltransferase